MMNNTMSLVRRALDEYNMIDENDKIAVGLSGGKDSILLPCALNEIKKFYPKKFDIVAVTIDMGFDGMDFTQVKRMCEEKGIEYHVHKSDIAEIVFNVRKEKNPCSLCARMRRGVIHDVSKALGCNKLALGHNFDDAVQTVLLNLFFEGRFGCFSPVTYLSIKDIHMIRPLIYLTNDFILQTVQRLNLPVVKSTCPMDKHTKREEINDLIKTLSKQYPDIKKKIFGALKKSNIDRW